MKRLAGGFAFQAKAAGVFQFLDGLRIGDVPHVGLGADCRMQGTEFAPVTIAVTTEVVILLADDVG